MTAYSFSRAHACATRPCVSPLFARVASDRVNKPMPSLSEPRHRWTPVSSQGELEFRPIASCLTRQLQGRVPQRWSLTPTAIRPADAPMSACRVSPSRWGRLAMGSGRHWDGLWSVTSRRVQPPRDSPRPSSFRQAARP